MGSVIDDALRGVARFRAVSSRDRTRPAEVSPVRSHHKREAPFAESDASDFLYTIISGRAKVIESIQPGKE